MIKENYFDFYYKTILSLIINYFVVRVVIEALDIETTFFISLIIFSVSLFFILLLKGISKKTISIIFFICISFFVILYLNKYQTETFIKLINIRNEYINWMIDYMKNLTFFIDKYIS